MAASTPSTDARALIAVDLGAESCRVSLLRWIDGTPHITLVHRFANAPRQEAGALRWDLATIESGLDDGLRQCAALATEGVRSIAVDGWAVDYVRLDSQGKPLADPFCYRDERTLAAEPSLHSVIAPERIRALTGVQLLRINTLYQLHADTLAHTPPTRWLNLPEYILHRWGGEPVAEFTNATHTQLIDLHTGRWSGGLFAAAGVDLTCAPRIVSPGTIVGRLTGPLAQLPALRDAVLIAPACHDTASAIASLPAEGDDWAYISSGTWSLVGTLLDGPIDSPAAAADNFTNLGAAGGKTCFHKNVNGMWLLRQCMDVWSQQGREWAVEDLVAAAQTLPQPHGLLEVDDPELMLAGDMPARINRQRRSKGMLPLNEDPENGPAYANLIFYSLAARYADVLESIAKHTGKRLRRLFLLGGGSRNEFLNALTAQATQLAVIRGSAEGSTLGNFAVQLATLRQDAEVSGGVCAADVSHWARVLAPAS